MSDTCTDASQFSNLKIRDASGGDPVPLPSWANRFVELGWKLAQSNSADGRIYVFCLVASRDHAASFIALGAILSSARYSKGKLSMEQMLSMENGARIFWRDKAGNKFEGVKIENESIDDEFVSVKIEKSSKKSASGTFTFSRGSVGNNLFSEVRLTSRADSANHESIKNFLKELGIDPGPGWLDIAKCEAQISTNIGIFLEDCGSLSLSAGSSNIVGLTQLLQPASDSINKSHRVRLKSIGSLDNDRSMLHILDGSKALRKIDNIQTGHVVALLGYSEYSEGINSLIASFHQMKARDLDDLCLAYPGFEQIAMIG